MCEFRQFRVSEESSRGCKEQGGFDADQASPASIETYGILTVNRAWFRGRFRKMPIEFQNGRGILINVFRWISADHFYLLLIAASSSPSRKQ